MTGFLRQATAAQSRALGPFLDSTDFVTPETGLTIANTDIKLIVNGGASANKNSGGGTHRANGVYGVTFDATDSATVGEMEVSVIVAGALPVFDKFTVIEEVVYDALYVAGALGYGRSNIKKNTALANFEFLMTLTADNTPAPGKTVTVTRSIDNGAFAAGTLSAVTENPSANGMYAVDFGAGDLNGNVVTLKAAAALCNDRFITIITAP